MHIDVTEASLKISDKPESQSSRRGSTLNPEASGNSAISCVKTNGGLEPNDSGLGPSSSWFGIYSSKKKNGILGRKFGVDVADRNVFKTRIRGGLSYVGEGPA